MSVRELTRLEYVRLVTLGIEKTGVRMQDAEQTGKLYEAFKSGEISENEWDNYIKKLHDENRISKHI